MSIFVWDAHFADWTYGLAVVLANDLEETRRLLRVQVGYDHDDIQTEPKVFPADQPRAWTVYGGS